MGSSPSKVDEVTVGVQLFQFPQRDMEEPILKSISGSRILIQRGGGCCRFDFLSSGQAWTPGPSAASPPTPAIRSEPVLRSSANFWLTVGGYKWLTCVQSSAPPVFRSPRVQITLASGWRTCATCGKPTTPKLQSRMAGNQQMVQTTPFP